MNNPYEVLGVSETATDEEIKARIIIRYQRKQRRFLLAH